MSSFFRCLVAAGGALMLASCAGVGTRPAGDSSPAEAPLAHLQAPPVDKQTRSTTQLMAGEFARLDGDTAGAQQAYARAAALSDNPRVAQVSARAAMDQGDRDAAQQAIQQMQAQGASGPALARERARLALLRGHRQQALEQLRKLLKTGTKAAWQDVAGVLAGARDPALAGVLLADLANPDSLPTDDVSVWLAVSQLGEKLGRHEYARSIAGAAAKRFATARAYAWSAHLQMAAGHDKRGLTLLAKAFKADPDNTRVRHTYAMALGEADRYQQALEVLRQGPQDLQALATRAFFAGQIEDRAELEQVYTALKTHRHGYKRNVDFLLGRLAEALHKPDQALAFYAAVPQTDERIFQARLRQVVLLAGQGHATRAQQLARQMQHNQAGDKNKLSQIYLLEGNLHARAGEHEQAVAAYNRGLDVLPDDNRLLYARALSEADMGHTQTAVADLRRVLQSEPDDVQAMNALGYTLADENRDLEEAEDLLRKALAAEPDAPAIMDSWGWLRYRQGDLEEAAKYLRKAWGGGPDAEIGAHLGEVLWQLGERDQAREVFDKAKAEDPDNRTLTDTLQRLQP